MKPNREILFKETATFSFPLGKLDEIKDLAKCEGLSYSAYIITLHNDHVRYARENGHPQPIEVEVD